MAGAELFTGTFYLLAVGVALGIALWAAGLNWQGALAAGLATWMIGLALPVAEERGLARFLRWLRVSLVVVLALDEAGAPDRLALPFA